MRIVLILLVLEKKIQCSSNNEMSWKDGLRVEIILACILNNLLHTSSNIETWNECFDEYIITWTCSSEGDFHGYTPRPNVSYSCNDFQMRMLKKRSIEIYSSLRDKMYECRSKGLYECFNYASYFCSLLILHTWALT